MLAFYRGSRSLAGVPRKQHHARIVPEASPAPRRRDVSPSDPDRHGEVPSLMRLQASCGNRAVVGMLGHASTAPAQMIHRYFDLKQATQAKLGVTAKQGTMFPGHEKDDDNYEFLKGKKGIDDSGGQVVNRVDLAAVPDLAVSDDGNMAVEAAAIDA